MQRIERNLVISYCRTKRYGQRSFDYSGHAGSLELTFTDSSSLSLTLFYAQLNCVMIPRARWYIVIAPPWSLKPGPNMQQCRSSVRLCRNNIRLCSIRQCCFDIVAGVDGVLAWVPARGGWVGNRSSWKKIRLGHAHPWKYQPCCENFQAIVCQ